MKKVITPKPFPLRMPESLRKWLTNQAKKNRRSLNSELVFRIEEIKQRQQNK